MVTEPGPYRTGGHSPINVWLDPERGDKTGEQIAMATSPEWAKAIVDALNAMTSATGTKEPTAGLPVVGPCSDCGREMISRSTYSNNRDLRGRYVPFRAKGLCGTCYSNARYRNRPKPAPKPMTVTQCRDCGRNMVSSWTYSAKPELRSAGYVQHAGHQMCRACYGHAQAKGTLPNPAPRKRPRRTHTPRANSPRANSPRATPLSPDDVARLRAAVGITDPVDRHARGEVTG